MATKEKTVTATVTPGYIMPWNGEFRAAGGTDGPDRFEEPSRIEATMRAAQRAGWLATVYGAARIELEDGEVILMTATHAFPGQAATPGGLRPGKTEPAF